jgi:hypothetical protein
LQVVRTSNPFFLLPAACCLPLAATALLGGCAHCGARHDQAAVIEPFAVCNSADTDRRRAI